MPSDSMSLPAQIVWPPAQIVTLFAVVSVPSSVPTFARGTIPDPKSAAEVRTLARALESGSVAPVLRPETPVTVDEGATLEVAGECHVVQTLACAGTLAFKDAGQLEVTGTTAVTGELLGAGTLILDAGGNFRKADASGFDGTLVVKGGKAILNRTFKPLAREVSAGAEVVWIEAGTMLIFR